MMKTHAQALPLSLTSYKTYLWATVFIAGNLIFPQLFHVAGLGGKAFLPILFFTLIAASRYGLACGLVTAVVSPLLNNLLFGMPGAEMLAVIVVKSAVLALVIGLAVQKTGKLSLISGLAGIAAYQIAGMLFFALTTGSWSAAWADVVISWPAMVLQIVAVWVMLQIPTRKAA